MSLLEHAPAFDAAAAAALCRDLYGIDADAAPLTSERDQNFLLTAKDGGRFTLKIANALEERALLEAQNGAMAHVARQAPLCPVARVSVSGETIATVTAAGGGTHFVRLLTWVDGEPLVNVRRHSRALLEDLGRRLGGMDAALATFDHPALHRDFYWDVAHAAREIAAGIHLVSDGDVRALVEKTAQSAEALIAPLVRHLPRAVIHGDANDHNVLVSMTGDVWSRAQRVAGFVDFGDMVHSFAAADLAIAIAYAVLEKNDPVAAARAVCEGYHAVRPLTADEIAALFPLVQLRLCASVAIAARQQRDRPGDGYLAVSQDPIARTLPRLASLAPALVEATFRAACGLDPPPRSAEMADARTGAHLLDPPATSSELARRRRYLGPNLGIAYRTPIQLARGWMQYLYDVSGRQYLDGYNNVPHVGHCHPRVVAAASDQLRTLNTNTRYLHDGLVRYAERLASTLPDPLRVCYFVNSGSEANELALRLARTHTRHRDVVVLDAGYHGNTTTLVKMSPYKFNGPGGEGAPRWVHVGALPDVYRGAYKKDDPGAGGKYASDVAALIEHAEASGRSVCAFIAETCPSVGGQIMLPAGYLDGVYAAVRRAGGVCIADEVQTAYGRIGTDFYAFSAHQVVPDIVVLGKPIGNGYPLGAVVTTEEIAASFDNGMEFFSTFGGSTVSCAVGLAVLDVVQEERLQQHAREVGDRLLAHLRSLERQHALVGDVRGSGLFIGVELVTDRRTLAPATREASYVVERLCEEGILIGTDGPFDNVLKIRPPMPFGNEDADRLAETLDRVLREPGVSEQK